MPSDQFLGLGGRLLARRLAQRRAGLDGGPVEQPPGGRDRQHRRGLRAAAGLAEDHHPARIAPKARDVVAHPSERGDHVHDAADAGVAEGRRCAEVGQVRVAEGRQPVVHRDHDHIAEQGHARAIVHRSVARTRGPAAPVERHEHRPPRLVVHRRRPDVEVQAVLAHSAGTHMPVPGDQRGVVAGELGGRLRRDLAVADGLAHPCPGDRRPGRHETVPTAGRCAVGHALERLDPAVGDALDPARGGLDGPEDPARRATAAEHTGGRRRRGLRRGRGACEGRARRSGEARRLHQVSRRLILLSMASPPLSFGEA